MMLIDEDIWLHVRNHVPLKTSRQGMYVVCLLIIGILHLAMCHHRLRTYYQCLKYCCACVQDF